MAAETESNGGSATATKLGQKEFHIAPMIDVSTIEFRYFTRLLTKRAVIWNQMVVAETLVHRSRIHKERNKDCKKVKKENASCEPSPSNDDSDIDDVEEPTGDEVELTPDLMKYCGWYDGCEEDNVDPHPTVCQIGSNSPEEAAFAIHIAQRCGYDSIDLNSECPSDRVAGRCFGAALMKEQDTAVDVVSSMVRTAQSLDKPLPVSVKTRIGVDDDEGFDFIEAYIQKLVDAGCNQFIIHARKVYTQGLSPAQNRDVPPLDYPVVYRLMEAFPKCSFLMNGGIRNLVHARELAFGSTIKFDELGNGEKEACASNNACADDNHVVPCQICNLPQGSCLTPPRVAHQNLRGVMVARLARDRPADLADVDRYFYGEESNPCRNRRELMERYISFLERVYPRRCCDDDETTTLGMVRDMTTTIIPKRRCCSVCEEFRGQSNGESMRPLHENGNIDVDKNSAEAKPLNTANCGHQRKQSGKRQKRHNKYGGAKIVTRIMDRALQPTGGILTGERGQKLFRRVSHELSRDKVARNCGPGYILWKAMKAVSDDVWDKPFELTGDRRTTYYPTK